MRSFVLVLLIAAGCLASLAYAGEPVAAPQFMHFTVYLDATTGEMKRAEHDATPISGEACLKLLEGMGGRMVTDGLAQVHLCRQVDRNGNPVPEIKVNPETLAPLKPEQAPSDKPAPVQKST
jgi:hypothetical protein